MIGLPKFRNAWVPSANNKDGTFYFVELYVVPHRGLCETCGQTVNDKPVYTIALITKDGDYVTEVKF